MRSLLQFPLKNRRALAMLTLAGCLLPAYVLSGQGDIRLANPSFESKPRIGIDASTRPIEGWTDCGLVDFPGTSPPDIHPLPKSPWYGASPVSGNTYLGMVCRSNLTWESLSQTLPTPMAGGACYRFTCSLISLPEILLDISDSPKAAILRIWGGSATCAREELLGQSPGIPHSEWREYNFHLRPSQSWLSITLEAWYSTGTDVPHSGHLLVDGASALLGTDGAASPQGLVAVMEVPPGSAVHAMKSSSGPPAIGQRYPMPSVHFTMDSAELPPGSHADLEALYRFLREHPGMVIEIGGHTNTVPPDNYCDALSLARAEAVRNWLIDRGVLPDRLRAKGYGKRQPIIRYDPYSRAGRIKNQRVEIRIISL